MTLQEPLPHLLTLYGRAHCPLCDQMREALRPWEARLGFRVEVVDVDSDAVLQARYGRLVPVLAGGGYQICHYFFKQTALLAYFERLRADG